MAKKIFLIRHGQSINNSKGLWGGDSPLSDAGKKQAAMATIPDTPALVVSSGKIRAIETATIMFPEYDREVNKHFNEIDFGKYENLIPPEEEVEFAAKELPLFLLKHGGDDLQVKMQNVDREISTYLQQINNGESIAIVCHDMVIRSFLQYKKGRPLNKTREENEELKNCGYVKLEVFHNEP